MKRKLTDYFVRLVSFSHLDLSDFLLKRLFFSLELRKSSFSLFISGFAAFTRLLGSYHSRKIYACSVYDRVFQHVFTFCSDSLHFYNFLFVAVQ